MNSPTSNQSSLVNTQHWIFDMDGTLTLAIHDFDEIRATLGLPQGKPILEEIDKLEPEHAAKIHRQLDELEMEIAGDAKAQPGAIALLETLKTMGKHVGILTRNGKDIADATLAAAGLDHFFTSETIVSRDCCTAKPDPAGIHLLLDRWQTTAESSVMIGDYRYDLEAGHAAGTATVHMDVDAEFAWPELTTYKVSSLTALLALLNDA